MLITNSHVTGNLSNLHNNLGGIIGLTAKTVTSLKLDACSFDGTVSGVSYVGGIAGGIAQRAPSVEITRCFSKGEVKSSGNYAGGLIGAAQGNQTIANCYSAAQAYHGKAAAADATLSSVAKSLGWDETVWDLSKDLPALK